MMQFRICGLLGCTLRELKDRMDLEEFNLWCVYYSVEPWGSELEQLNAGIISATVENCRANRGRGKTSQPLDYMPIARRNNKLTWRPQTQEEQIAVAERMASMMGGLIKFTDNRKKVDNGQAE